MHSQNIKDTHIDMNVYAWPSLTVVHKRLDCPEVDADHKAGEVAGNVLMMEQVRYLHLMLDLLQLLRGQKFKVDVANRVEEVGWFVLGYEDPRLARETNTCAWRMACSIKIYTHIHINNIGSRIIILLLREIFSCSYMSTMSSYNYTCTCMYTWHLMHTK